MATGFTPDDFPSRFDFAQAQPRIYRQWEEAGLFHSEPDPTRKPFTIVIPPPNVTGALHLGHALNNTLQDTLIRLRKMQGYNTLWMPGTDHAGIATQAVVERRLLQEEKKTRHDLGRDELVRRIWKWKAEYETRILHQLKQMGCSCDWQRTRFTLDEQCAHAVRATFFDLFGKGLIYRGKRLVNWDTYLQTAVSDDEVFHEVVKGHFYHFQYPVIDPQPGEPTHVTIATTRPETMLGDTAVAVHPDPAKALDQVEADLRAKLAEAPAKERAGIEQQIEAIAVRRREMLPLLIKLRDMALAGRKLKLPLANREIPLIADLWAKPELGSGCVKITPAHDANDYEVWQRNQQIGTINILNPDGTLNELVEKKYRGLKMMEARKQVVADLEALGLVAQIEDREIDLAHSDRSKTPIEPYLADQWFVKMSDHDDGRAGLAQIAMDAVASGRVKIVPARYAKSYLDWLGEKRDWCIGRQLWWGHRVPVWYVQCPESVLKEAFAGQEKEVFWRECGPGGQWHLCALHDLTSEDERRLQAVAEQQGAKIPTPLVQDPDVLDTWFSSALWPHSTLGWPEQTPELKYYYPTSVLITSRDIITLWVARMVLTGLNNIGEVPFREVFIHPKILDGYGETMSKSKGNGIDPLDVVDKFGADALRFGLAQITTETQDVRMPVQFECPHCEAVFDQTKKNRELPRVPCAKCGQPFSTQWAKSPEDTALPKGRVVSERFEQARNFCNKLWNAARFAMLNMEGYTAAPVAENELTVEDRWILSRLATVTRETTQCLNEYRYADAARALYDFAWDQFCSFYVEMAKPRLQDPKLRATAQRVLAHTLDTLLRLLHPMIPFITENIWQLLAKVAPTRGLPKPAAASQSIMLAPWPTADLARQDTTIETRFAQFQQVLAALRDIRSRQNIPPRTAIQFSVRCDAAQAELLKPMETYFQSMANASGTAWGPAVTPPPTHAQAALAGLEIFVDMKDLIDVPAEIARNEKQLGNLTQMIAAKQVKLSNASFVDRAPAEVVAKERESLAQLQEQLSAVQSALVELRKAQP